MSWLERLFGRRRPEGGEAARQEVVEREVLSTGDASDQLAGTSPGQQAAVADDAPAAGSDPETRGA